MKFDAYAVLAKLRSKAGGRANRATCANQPAPFSTFSTISTEPPADAVKSDAPPISTFSTFSTGQGVQPPMGDEPVGNVIAWTGKRYSPEAIRQGVAEAFEDWEAMNDPHDPRAWA